MTTFKHTKKIKTKSGYFQVANSEHPQYGEAIAVAAIPTKQKEIDGKMTPVPDYDKKSTLFLQFNQASRLAAYLRTGAIKVELGETFQYKIESKKSENKKSIKLSDVAFNKTINVEFLNGSHVILNFNLDTANIAADLITQRLMLMTPNGKDYEAENEDEAHMEEEYHKTADDTYHKLATSNYFSSGHDLDKYIENKMRMHKCTRDNAILAISEEVF